MANYVLPSKGSSSLWSHARQNNILKGLVERTIKVKYAFQGKT